jgi:hypothetical protein
LTFSGNNLMEATMAARKQASFQIIPTKIHAMEDYALAVLLLVAPFLLKFADGTAAQWVPMFVGVMILGVSLLTRYELGAYPLIPMPMHLMLDAGAAVLLAASPWIFGFADRVYLPHLILGLGELVVVALSRTQPREVHSFA